VHVPDPDVIEFSSAKPAHPARKRLLIAGVAVAVIVIAAVAVLVGIRPGGTAPGGTARGGSAPGRSGPSGGAAGGHGNPALARLIAQVTGVPAGASQAAGDGHGQVAGRPSAVTGPALDANGRPEVLYVATEYCPYCAAQSWALLVALSRFGTFTGLDTIRSGNYQPYPDLATWTFYGSAYSSRYLTFVPVETKSNVLTARTANPQDGSSYARLQKLTAAEQAVFNRYDKPGSVPFLDFGNREVIVGSSFSPLVLQKLTWSQIAAALREPVSLAGWAVLGAANYITAAICQLTGDQPARACTPAVRRLLRP
jgi:Domain of unknown function (DUF929)